MKRRTMKAMALVVLFLVTACAPAMNLTLGQMPDQDPGARLEAGMTTKQEVLELFGPPDFTGIDENGLPRWTWTRITLRVEKLKEASITSFFNMEVSFRGDLVDSYTYSRKAPESAP